jgi:hypothetical protein
MCVGPSKKIVPAIKRYCKHALWVKGGTQDEECTVPINQVITQKQREESGNTVLWPRDADAEVGIVALGALSAAAQLKSESTGPPGINIQM